VPFAAIAGHRRALSLLSRAIARGTMPPAVLLAGPRGVGKRRTAQAIAEAVNCLDPRHSADFEIDACGACASCRRIARGAHPDVIVLEPGDTGSIKIEPVRDVVVRAGYRPFEGRRRVVIIDDADALVGSAQNALLKTLEEPPSATTFLLVSSMPDSLLPTVRSRCPRLRFAPLSPDEVARTLIRDHGYGEADARAAAAEAGGSLALALEAQSVDLTQARETAQRLLESTARVTDPARRLDAVKDLTVKGSSAGERDQLAVCLRAMASLLRDLGILAHHGDRAAIANADLQPALDKLTASYDGRRTARAFEAVTEAIDALERNASAKVVADWLVLQL
jgi:DNA polymerase-3 subunit delta'